MSNEIYQNNLSALAKHFPEVYRQLQQRSNDLPFKVEPFTTDCGQANALVTLADGRQLALYEAQDIVGSAKAAMAQWQLAAQDILFFIGIGLGYYPLSAAKTFGRQPSLVVIEPCAAVFDLALELVDLSSLLTYEHLDLIIGNGFKANDIINHYKRHIFVGKQRVITHVPSLIIHGEPALVLEKELKDYLSLTKDLWQTNLQSGQEMLSNLMANLPSLVAGVSLDKMKGVFAGFPALCVAAGPSLDESVAAIKELQDKILIVALDSAISTLIPAGIRPHIVVTCDTRRLNFEKVRPYLAKLRNSILVFALESNPDNVRAFPGTHRLAVAGDKLLIKSWLGPALNIDCSLPAMSTVSHTAIYSMMALGADPIVVVGMDMAFPIDKTHAQNAVNRYANMPEADLIEVPGTNGLAVRTYRPMIDYTRQLECVIADSPHRFVNSCMSGMFIQGMEIKSLQEVAETELDPGANINQLLNGLNWDSPLSETDLISALKSKRQELDKYRDQCRLGIKTAEAVLNRLQNREISIDLKVTVENFHKFYNQLQKDNKALVELLFSIRLEKIREIEIKQLELHRNSENIDASLRIQKELQLIQDDFASQRDAASFFGSLIAEREEFWKKVYTLKTEIELDAQDQSKQLKLANLYAEAGEIMLAEYSYRRIMQSAPDEVRIPVELARLYLDSQLWSPAYELIQNAYRAFPDAPQVKALKEYIDKEISSIKDSIKEAWARGDKARSQNLLNEYLLLCPKDEEANRIQKVIMNKGLGIAPDLPYHHADPLPVKQFDFLLTKSAGFIGDLEFEKAVGVIEGLIKKFPPKVADLREKIGDIRMLQKDYPSAVWNYNQVQKADARAFEIKIKINKALIEAEHRN